MLPLLLHIVSKAALVRPLGGIRQALAPSRGIAPGIYTCRCADVWKWHGGHAEEVRTHWGWLDVEMMQAENYIYASNNNRK